MCEGGIFQRGEDKNPRVGEKVKLRGAGRYSYTDPNWLDSPLKLSNSPLPL